MGSVVPLIFSNYSHLQIIFSLSFGSYEHTNKRFPDRDNKSSITTWGRALSHIQRPLLCCDLCPFLMLRLAMRRCSYYTFAMKWMEYSWSCFTDTLYFFSWPDVRTFYSYLQNSPSHYRYRKINSSLKLQLYPCYSNGREPPLVFSLAEACGA